MYNIALLFIYIYMYIYFVYIYVLHYIIKCNKFSSED